MRRRPIRGLGFVLSAGACTACLVVVACGAFSGSPSEPPEVDVASSDGSLDEAATPSASEASAAVDASADVDLDASIVVEAGTGILFVTSVAFVAGKPPFDDLLGGDAVCKTLADATPLRDRKWRALLSGNVISAYSRIAPRMLDKYVRPDLLPIGSLFDIFDGGALAHEPNISEKMTRVSCGPASVWTGSDPAGKNLNGQTCFDWTQSALTGARGDCSAGDGAWLSSTTSQSCAEAAMLYCVEQK